MKRFGIKSWILIMILVVTVFFIVQWKFKDSSRLHSKIETTTNNNKKVKIFAATKFFSDVSETIDSYMKICSKEIQGYCEILHDELDFQNADAVLFHAKDYERHTSQWMFENRNPKIPYVVWTMESPMLEQNFPDFMNLTMSYDRKADIYWPYGNIRKKQKIEDNPKSFEDIWKKKKKSDESAAEIIWMVSNCITPNRRMEIVEKIKTLGMKIDIFGGCGMKPKKCEKKTTMDCEVNLVSTYKFYMAIENAYCEDYITEKFWINARDRFAVPIILGKQIYLDAGIPEKAFIALDDFKNLDEFKSFIDNLAENKTKYMEFHEWRKEYEMDDIFWNHNYTPEILNNYGLCKLCQNLKSGKYSNNFTNVYPTLIGKWHKRSDCNNSIGYRFLKKFY
ncbi:unnamed protein product [Caenorhabditis angaria]|uniref:Fucosyltransferase n=1 Tax=Caenorhabditis angaria TaxID=860376 RepID=A0A9P1MXC9_9PELO|nr:unnamed protein product [Caenorhabditis angaria]